MAMHPYGVLTDFDSYEFSELPKGEMLSISINPYNGKLFIKASRKKAAGRIAYAVLQSIVDECKRLELSGSCDPVADLLSAGSEFKQARKAVIRPFKGRSATGEIASRDERKAM